MTLVPGYWHFNLAADGQGEGIEENVLVRYAGGPLTVIAPEGAVWWYRESCFAADLNGLWFRTLRDSTDDYWPAELPSFLRDRRRHAARAARGELIRESAPMATTEYVWPVQTIVVETEESEIEEPAARTRITGVPTSMLASSPKAKTRSRRHWVTANWRGGFAAIAVSTSPGSSQPSSQTWASSTAPCLAGRTLPSVNNLNVEHDFRTVAEAETAGIQFSPAVEDSNPQTRPNANNRIPHAARCGDPRHGKCLKSGSRHSLKVREERGENNSFVSSLTLKLHDPRSSPPTSAILLASFPLNMNSRSWS